MRMLPPCVTCLVLVATGWCAAGNEATPLAKYSIGKKIDTNRLVDFPDVKGARAAVVVFLTFDCPVSNSYLAELTEMARGHKDVAFLGVCSAAADAAEVAKNALAFQVGFPVLADPRQAVAAAFQAVTTPEAFVLDKNQVVRYRGRIDDAYAARLKKNKSVTRHDLREALAEVVAGRPVSQPVTVAVGCPIVRGQSGAVTTKITYHKDVLPILQKHCQQCHRAGEMGPFALMTYRDAVNWAADIKEFTSNRRMPPWKPVESVAFRGDRKMTDREIGILAEWVDGGRPEGNAQDAPPPATFAEGWKLGQPDLILAVPEDFTLGATGPDVFRCFVLPTGLTEDKFVIGYEVRPGNRQVVHHTLHFLDLKGRARKLDARAHERPRRPEDRDAGPGYSSVMGPGFFPPSGDVGGWAPGISPHFFPDGVGYYLPKRSDFVLQIHYHRTGKVEKDRTQVGLHFARKPCKPLQPMIAGGQFLSIPAGEANYAVKGRIWAAQDCLLHTVTPHMHLLGKKIKLTMTPPGGATTTLVRIDDWDFNWQEIYVLKESIPIKEGTRFDVEAVFDNSTSNPYNPNSPPRRVFVGEQTTNEMCFGFFGATTDQTAPIGFRLWPDGFIVRRLGVLPKPAAENP